MKLRLGQPVHTTDGIFGEVGDIVVDPAVRNVTHLVVEPHHQHYQARLVPIAMVSVVGDIVKLNIDTTHLRQMQRVAETDFVHRGAHIHNGEGWDVGTEDVVSRPTWTDAPPGVFNWEARIGVTYDRIPHGECEIRSKSSVLGVDAKQLGFVDGFLVDDEQLAAVVVRPRWPTRQRHVLLPMSVVTQVSNDEIRVSIDRSAFRQLPSAQGLQGPLGEGPVDSLRRRVSSAVRSVRTRRKVTPAGQNQQG